MCMEQVLSREELLKLLDRRDVTWGKKEAVAAPLQELPGVFKVLSDEDTTSGLPSVIQ